MKIAVFALFFASLLAAQEAIPVPEQANQLVAQGILTTHTENCQTALPYFERAVALDSKSAEAWYELGMCKGRLGQQAAKAAALDKAIAARPTYTAARHQLILALRLAGQTKEAQHQLAELRKYDAALAAGVEKAITGPTQLARATNTAQ